MPVNFTVVGLVFGRDGVWVGEAVVKESFIVMFEGDFGKSAPLNSFVIVTAGIDVMDFYFLPVAATFGKTIGKQCTVFAKSCGG